MATNRLEIAELDFDSIKQNLKSFLKQQSQFSDYDFEPCVQDEIVEFMESNQNRLREMSLRMALKIADLRKSFAGNWKRMAETTCMKSA